MKLYVALLTAIIILLSIHISWLYDRQRLVEDQVNKVVVNTVEILSNQGMLINLEKVHLYLTKSNLDLFSDMLPRPECVNIELEHQWRDE